MSVRNRAARKRAITWIVSVIILIVFVFPLYWWVTASVKPFGAIFASPPRFRFTPTLEWYNVVILGHPYEQTEVARTGAITGEGGGSYYAVPSLRDSFVVAFGSTVLATGVAASTAYGLSRFSFRGRNHLTFWILSTRMMPPFAVAVPFYFMFQRFNLLDSYLGLILAHMTMNVPLSILLLRSFFDDLPRSLDEAALVDGATRWQAFWRIIVPCARPGIAAAAILSFMFSWNEFLLSLVLTAVRVRTMPVVASTFVTSYGTEWGFLAALGTAALLPGFVVVLLVQKHIVRGLTMGAVRY